MLHAVLMPAVLKCLRAQKESSCRRSQPTAKESNGLKPVRSRLFDYQSKQQTKVPKPLTANKENQKLPKESTVKTADLNQKRKAFFDHVLPGPGAKKRRHSELIPKKAARPGILKRKSCVGSIDLTDQKISPDEEDVAHPTAKTRRLSYTVTPGSGEGDQPHVGDNHDNATTRNDRPDNGEAVEARNVRFLTPPYSGRTGGLAARKTPKPSTGHGHGHW